MRWKWGGGRMRTLYERLKPEYKAMLESEMWKYPTSVNRLTDKLKAEVVWTELTYGEVSMLVTYLNLKSYNPVTIANLFES